ncbi:MAG: type II toxin-antitoxin system Phd/YefM family antitoxin [Actinobacteria bacterium]|nr:type II toxin-antitoxin system Phd/YefM family antitoxin [Actinomycetota bacterium]
MRTVTVRELRNNGGAVLDQVARGEELVVTRDGAEIAELRPRRRPGPAPADLIARRRHLPKVEPGQLHRELDAVLDPTV